ncbi:hypothetical protein FB451DRAFT_1568157 [Mycena latifolia]|nr:hypothetical protein FB451DRAFT_1568157 [Mycena latifolia]
MRSRVEEVVPRDTLSTRAHQPPSTTTSVIDSQITFDIQLRPTTMISIADYIPSSWTSILSGVLAFALVVGWTWGDRFLPSVTTTEKLDAMRDERDVVLTIELSLAHTTTRFIALKARIHRLCDEYHAAVVKTADHTGSWKYLWGIVDIVACQGLRWWLRGWRDLNSIRMEIHIIKTQDGIFKGSRPIYTEATAKADMEIAMKTEEELRPKPGRSADDAEKAEGLPEEEADEKKTK